jgi:N-acetylated-alpha-linked acidic dipeptidase
MYDDFYWMNHIGDPGYRYHTALSQVWGVLALRLANADVLPFDFGFYGRDVRKFLVELRSTTSPVDLSAVIKQAAEFSAAGDDLKRAVETALSAGPISAGKTAALNEAIMQVESNWLIADGIPGRPWFKHSLYAARYTYAHLELPGITEALEKGDWKTAREQALFLEKALVKNTTLLRQATVQLKAAQ